MNLNALSHRKIYFAHQSVGQNIVDAIQDMALQFDMPDFVITSETDIKLGSGFLLHEKVGQNKHPLSKLEHFERALDTHARTDIDIAMLKLCYIDIDQDTDIDSLFKSYRETFQRLSRAHPDIRFIHCTAPLRSVDQSVGVWLRELTGRPNNSKLANIKRFQFSQLLLEEYSASCVFDLGLSESMVTTGGRCQFKYKSAVRYPCLAEVYTSDGGHLNETGAKKVASDLINFIAAPANRQVP